MESMTTSHLNGFPFPLLSFFSLSHAFKNALFIYLFIFGCGRSSSLCGLFLVALSGDYSLVVVYQLLMATSLVAEPGL